MPGIMAEPQRPLLGDEPVRDVAATELFGEIGGWLGRAWPALPPRSTLRSSLLARHVPGG